MLTDPIKSFGTFLVIATTSSFITVSLTGISLIAIPESVFHLQQHVDYQLLTNKVKFEIVMQKHIKYKKQY